MLASIQKMTNKSYILDDKITVVSGVGPKIQQVFNSIGIYKIRDLLIDYFIKIDTLKPKIDNRFIRTK